MANNVSAETGFANTLDRLWLNGGDFFFWVLAPTIKFENLQTSPGKSGKLTLEAIAGSKVGEALIDGQNLSWHYDIFTGHAAVSGQVSKITFKFDHKTAETWTFAPKLDLHQFQVALEKYGTDPSIFNDLMSASPTKFEGSSGKDMRISLNANDTLHGNGGNDTLGGGGGDDKLFGGSGKDVFLFGPHGGHDTIKDFDSKDKIDLSAFASVHSLADITVTKHGKDLELDFGNGDILTLHHVSKSDLGSHSLIFHA